MQDRKRLAPCARRATLLVLGAGCSALAWGQAPTEAQKNQIRQACRSDYMSYCSSVPPGGAASLSCLQQNAAQLSSGCQNALAALADAGSAGRAPGVAAPPPPPAAASTATTAPAAPDAWPHTVTAQEGSAIVYQPQVISWPDRQTLNTRIAVATTPTGATRPTFGTLEVAFRTSTDLRDRTVSLYEPKLVASNFPALPTDRAMRVEERAREVLARMGVKQVPLDMVLASLRNELEKSPPEAQLRNDAPAMFYSARPASLLVFDGEPVLAPIAGTTLSAAVNTNWDVFVETGSGTWYWLNNGGWLSAPGYRGPWSPVVSLPAAFAALPNDSNFAAVKQQIPGRRITPAEMPTVFVSTVPAEIIVTRGEPKYAPIPGTGLQYVANTDADLFFAGSTRLYYLLVSGRWFSAPNLGGPWTFATPALPPDFARIPPNGPRGSVLVSVPGTPQAREAVIQAQIPQQATLDRGTTTFAVTYTGEPRFEPVPGTAILYAVNTNHDVLLVDGVYYAVYKGAWFTAPTPTGVWVLADRVPPVVYTMPPSSPLYRVTYVQVASTTPTSVKYVYTSGYNMTYVSSGVVVYGTGFYYPPVIIPAMVPVYYPYPYTYAGSTWYNPTTGAWARGGTVYGPYGGAVSGGTAYNPQSGAWAEGARVYGPNGGAGAWSAYNPSTGGYAHGSSSWNTAGGAANANWYNGRSGVTGSTNQNWNQYGHWGSSTFSGADQTVTTQTRGNASGTEGSFRSSSGAEGAGATTAGGNRAGAAKTAGGDVYAGADGNVYKKTPDGGWSKWDNGSWQPVQPPAKGSGGGSMPDTGRGYGSGSSGDRGGAQQSYGRSTGDLSDETERGAAFRQGGEGAGGTYPQLDRDSYARDYGSFQQRAAQYRGPGGALGGGEGFGGRFAGGERLGGGFAGGAGFAGRFRR